MMRNRKKIVAASLASALVAFFIGCAPVSVSDNKEQAAKNQAQVSQNVKAAETPVYVPGAYAKAPLSDEQLKEKLTDLQYYVTQQDGTERPFSNKYWDNKQDGIYVDIVSGEPLFSSNDKYKSGTGWPSFSRPLVADNIVEKEDDKLFYTRIEIRSKNADSHLGHVFPDGPKPTGLRYCMNSASLRFVPKDQLVAQGYGEFLSTFK